MNCSVPANQPIYQALLDKAASYPADKIYQAKTYKKAAQSILTHTKDIYDIAKNNSWYQGQGQHIPGAGEGIRTFIKDFIKKNPVPTQYSEKAINEAHKIAAQNPPSVLYSAVLKAILAAPIDQPLTTQQIVAIVKEEASKAAAPKVAAPIGQPLTAQQIVKEEWSKINEQDLKLKQQRQDVRAAQRAKRREERVIEQTTPKTALDFYYESLKPVIYTAENPRRSKRVSNKPKTALDFYYESLKPVIYTAENPRRSKRVSNKPKIEYY